MGSNRHSTTHRHDGKQVTPIRGLLDDLAQTQSAIDRELDLLAARMHSAARRDATDCGQSSPLRARAGENDDEF